MLFAPGMLSAAAKLPAIMVPGKLGRSHTKLNVTFPGPAAREAAPGFAPLPITVIPLGTVTLMVAEKRFVLYPTIGNQRPAYSR